MVSKQNCFLFLQVVICIITVPTNIRILEIDSANIYKLMKDCGLELTGYKCKKCAFESHSDGLLRKHKRTSHQLKESNQNMILGFKIDIGNFQNTVK